MTEEYRGIVIDRGIVSDRNPEGLLVTEEYRGIVSYRGI